MPRVASHRLLALGLVFQVGACGRASDRAVLAVPSIDTMPDGMVVVRNSGPAEWSDTNGWRLELERTIRPTQDNPGALSDPGGIVANASGDIYVLDRRPAVIRHYSSDGVLVGTIGREGAGPGEFSDFGVLYLVGDTLVHHDQAQARLSLFDRDGTFLGSFHTGSHIATQLVADENGLVPLPISIPRAGGGERDGVIRYRLTGEVVDTILYPIFATPPAWEVVSKQRSMGMAVPFTASGWAVLAHSGRLVFGDDGEPRLYVSGQTRDTALRFEVPMPADRISDSVRQATLDQTIAEHPWIAQVAHLKDIPSVRPRWQDLQTDAASNIWVLSSPPSSTEQTWYVFSPEGVLRGKVPAPFVYGTASYWTSDRIYRIAEDSAGTPGIEIWRILR